MWGGPKQGWWTPCLRVAVVELMLGRQIRDLPDGLDVLAQRTIILLMDKCPHSKKGEDINDSDSTYTPSETTSSTGSDFELESEGSSSESSSLVSLQLNYDESNSNLWWTGDDAIKLFTPSNSTLDPYEQVVKRIDVLKDTLRKKDGYKDILIVATSKAITTDYDLTDYGIFRIQSKMVYLKVALE